ncbi:MAG: hypothetical protein R3C19_15895 [Planctomycetaceae bacterium]
MNARVFLLVLVTGLFMSAWNGDQAAMQAALASRDRARVNVVASDRSEESQTSAYTTTKLMPKSEPASSADLRDEHQRLPFPLPAGISAGRYQAVSDRGSSQLVVIPAGETQGTVERDLYITDAADGSRWYLIRQR